MAIDLKQQLDQHLADFESRQLQWDGLIARGRDATKIHEDSLAEENRRKAKAKKLHDAAHAIHHSIDAGSRFASIRFINRLTGRDENSVFARLHREHKSVDELKTGQAARLATFDTFRDQRFWQKYKAHLENGNYGRADRMLNMHARLALPIARLTGGKSGAADLRAQIHAAWRLADAHKENSKLLEKADKKLQKTERGAARIVHHLLDRDVVRSLMKSDMAKNSTDPNVVLLRELSQGHARTGRIQEELAARRGKIDLDSLAGSMKTLHKQAIKEERAANAVARVAQARFDKATAYVEGMRTARRYDTVVGHTATHTSRDIVAELRDYAGRDLSIPENREAAERLSKLAAETREQGLDKELASVDENLAKLKEKDFDAGDIGDAPDKLYRQKMLDQHAHQVTPSFAAAAMLPATDFYHLSLKPRVKHELVTRASSAFQTVVKLPTMAFGGAKTWLAKQSTDAFTGAPDGSETELAHAGETTKRAQFQPEQPV